MVILTGPAGAAEENRRSSSDRGHSSCFSVALCKRGQLCILLAFLRTAETIKIRYDQIYRFISYEGL